jgi:hypothetical protein
MLFMNEWEIGEARDRWARHPALGPATRFLDAFKNEVNRHSDGWPYWSAPVKAAGKLMTLILDSEKAARERGLAELSSPELAAVRKALAPIKAFMTRRGTAAGMTLPTLE